MLHYIALLRSSLVPRGVFPTFFRDFSTPLGIYRFIAAAQLFRGFAFGLNGPVSYLVSEWRVRGDR